MKTGNVIYAKNSISLTAKLKKIIKDNFAGYLFISPVILGIVIFTAWPMILSLYYSFFDYNAISAPTHFGLQNYIAPFTKDWKLFSKALEVTAIYTVIAVIMNLVLSFALALFLNQNIKGIKTFRVLYYLPVLIPAVVGGMLWKDMTDVKYGIFNAIFKYFKLPAQTFFSNGNTSLATLLLLGLFGLGGGMILWIAQFKSIPISLYESADIEGAGYFKKLLKITIPMSTPIIFYTVITSIIICLQTFSSVFIISGGGAGRQNSMLFYVLYIYLQAFNYFNMGFACALAWLLFIIIGILTFIIFKTSKWVYYGEDA